ncbi:uncharacterized protein B0T15DRAFT_398084 [Chaetomium strumarium]|uniref:Uncharacterized protein n=1 Tax=Chaetomium strumarium TaxID=1170767 RepID=A0AAJ0M1E8_9PEZI|nr:hypothetical protein B0T15DRAFT_398084 [Chaetomium strumarium]
MPPYDRPSAVSHRQPALARAVNKPPPLTPKIAGRSPASQHPNSTLSTPLARRTAPESTLAANATSSHDKDELMSPVSAFLSSNITPRSGSRQSRVDSANSTPSGTPNPDRHDPLETRPGLGVPGSGTEQLPRRPVVAFRTASEASHGAKPDRDSKFFYASEAQKQPPQAASVRTSAPQQPKSATFFYANGNAVPERQSGPPRPFSPTLASPSPSQDTLTTKFVYANGAPELQPPAKIGSSARPGPGSVVSMSSRAPRGRQGSNARAPSPGRSPQQMATKSPRNSTILSPRSPVSASHIQSGNQASQVKANTEPPCRPTKSHSRTKSATIIELPVTVKVTPAHSSVTSPGSTSPSSPRHSSTFPSNTASGGFSSLLQAVEDLAESEEAKAESLNSPTNLSQDGQVEDLVASARRERKVQDLQITNASLEAINRTLERQLRKQTAELRRYQRLSRSGQLSLGSAGSRIPSDSTADGEGLAGAGLGLNDLSEEQSEVAAEGAELEEAEELDDEDDMSSSEASGEPNPDASALRHEKRRRDERRLQLDISKHQQLLIDSQKINQSLKRCLGWTEELIKEGRRALAYQVRVSDVELGGRVLAPEEIERRARGDDAAEDNTLGDETIYAIDALGRGSLAEPETMTTWSKDPQDRDSGIELPADGG